jgi:hypothetical protein
VTGPRNDDHDDHHHHLIGIVVVVELLRQLTVTVMHCDRRLFWADCLLLELERRDIKEYNSGTSEEKARAVQIWAGDK